ncbi:MAG: non-ribosomal peptide synthetase [Propylenella sp.]
MREACPRGDAVELAEPGSAFEPFPASAIDGSISDRFSEIARRFPTRLAVSDESRDLTYAELEALVASIAAAIEAAEQRPGPVAILMPNEARYPAAILGVLAAGRACTPLDVENPIQRNRAIVRHAGAVAVVAAGSAMSGALSIAPQNNVVVDIDALKLTARGRPPALPRGDDVAWIIYTSGSTGTPKGVFQNHRNFLHDMRQVTNALRIGSRDRLGVVSPLALISGFRAAMSGILNGASLRILSPKLLQPKGIAQEFEKHGLTIFRGVPHLFRAIVAARSGRKLEAVRLVYLSGDRVEWEGIETFRQGFPASSELWVTLGSTEASTGYCQWQIDPSLLEPGLPVPVGRALPERAVALLDESGQPVADGAIGEFVVSSRFVALGYWNDPELTAERFGADLKDPEVRTFRTGDLGRRRPDGLFEFVGRKDHQIKLRGHRIEPNEIERALRGSPGVRDAAIVVRRSDAGVPRALVAYCELGGDGHGIMPRHLMRAVARALPEFMVPAHLFILEALPRLPKMKIDRIRLAEIDAERALRPAGRTGDALLEEVAGIIETVLGVSGATPEDSLASLGGDSLQAVEIMAEIETRFGLAVPGDIFASRRSIRDLASWIAAERVPRRRRASA